MSSELLELRMKAYRVLVEYFKLMGLLDRDARNDAFTISANFSPDRLRLILSFIKKGKN